MTLRILLVDDHPMFRESLRMILEMDPTVTVVGEVSDGRGVLAAVTQHNPDVVCMDINMPHLNGIEATHQLRAIHPHVQVIGLSAYASLASVLVMCNAGASGYVVKSDAARELRQAIEQVCQGGKYLSSQLGIKDISELRRQPGTQPRKEQTLSLL